MKLKLILAVGMLMSAFAASDARADDWCSLTVNQSTYAYIWRGQSFSYGIDIAAKPQTLPLPSPLPPASTFSIEFYGTNIPWWIGESYPGTFSYGHSELTGYQNPSSGGFSGTYTRYAVVRYNNNSNAGLVYCVTNEVTVVLQ